jgi:hypothetical protein
MMVLVVEEQTVLLTVCNTFTTSVLKKIMMVVGLGGLPVLRKNLLADSACSGWGFTHDIYLKQ